MIIDHDSKSILTYYMSSWSQEMLEHRIEESLSLVDVLACIQYFG